MSEVESKVSDQTDVVSDDIENQKKIEDKVAHSTYLKVLGEKKRLQAQYQEMQSKLDEAEKAKLEHEGKKDELITQLKSQIDAEKKRAAEVQKSSAMRVINMQVQAAAKDAGCVNPKALMKLASFDEVDFTDDLDLSEESVKKIISDAQKEHSYLFQKQVAQIKDATPGSNLKMLSGAQDLTKMKPSDLKNMLAMKLAKK